MGSIAESDRCSIARTRNRTVAILFNQKTACRTMFGRATSRATVGKGMAMMNFITDMAMMNFITDMAMMNFMVQAWL